MHRHEELGRHGKRFSSIGHVHDESSVYNLL